MARAWRSYFGGAKIDQKELRVAFVRDGAREHYCRATLGRHYTHIARRQYHDYIAGQPAPVVRRGG